MRLAHRRPALRCSYCHGPLLDSAPACACPGCSTLLHRECWTVLSDCPTLGCGWRTRRRQRQARPRPLAAERRLRLRRWSAASLAGYAVYFVVARQLASWLFA